MCRTIVHLISVVVLILFMMSPTHAVNIIVVNEAHDYDNDGKQDDYQLVEWLEAEGYTVDVRHDEWMTLDADRGP